MGSWSETEGIMHTQKTRPPSFIMLKEMYPSPFENINVEKLKCDAF